MTNTDTTKIFQKRLKKFVTDQKKTKKYNFDIISGEIGIKKSSLSKYLNDEAESGINNLVKIAKYFRISTDYLLGLSDVQSFQKETVRKEPEKINPFDSIINLKPYSDDVEKGCLNIKSAAIKIKNAIKKAFTH
ncbi:MAG: hypothetical protein RUMPE_00943 [Eubacteriales bacterium SKADARSKE-1]|nr:hypothetical protein [Eubacteriales bacterium SKADARSKE-1]